MSKATLEQSFLIEIDGQFVSKPLGYGPEGYGDAAGGQATVGGRDDAAVFTLQDGYLRTETDTGLMFLGRDIHEMTL